MATEVLDCLRYVVTGRVTASSKVVKGEAMKADTQAISIKAVPSRVLDLVADPLNLPRWAVGFARAVRRDGDRWMVTTAGGEVGLRIQADRAAGTVDFHIEP